MPDWRQLLLTDKLAWIIGSGFGAGFSPIAPGTAGSLAAALILYFASWQLIDSSVSPIAALVMLLVVSLMVIVAGFFVGVWATGKMSTPDAPDPGTAVWDEFVGMWIAGLATVCMGWILGFGWLFVGIGMLVSFFIFRCLDVWKPWPCRQLERLHGGWGIMLDDVAAGLIALVIMSLLHVGLARFAVWSFVGAIRHLQ
jgi:phosphatidylglycerophosphatase A